MDIVVDLARPADDAGIRGLVAREALPGRIRLALPREPDFSLGCLVTGDECRVLVARSMEDGAVVGVACRSIRHVFINGREQRIGYFGQLRVDERFRGRWLVSRGFSLLARIDREDPVSLYLASIVEGNVEATGVLVRRRRPSFPAFREAARYRTLALPLRRARPLPPGDVEITPGTLDRLSDVAAFLRSEGARRQFCSVWTEDFLRRLDALGLRAADMRVAHRAGRIVGVMALWDQTAYKQAVVRGYSGWLKAVAALSQTAAGRLTASVLPRVGSEVRSAYGALVCVANDDAVVFARLLQDIYEFARSRRFDYLLVGLDERDPLLTIARRYPHVAYPSRLYLASFPHRSHGERAHEQLDDRPAYVDIATL